MGGLHRRRHRTKVDCGQCGQHAFRHGCRRTETMCYRHSWNSWNSWNTASGLRRTGHEVKWCKQRLALSTRSIHCHNHFATRDY